MKNKTHHRDKLPIIPVVRNEKGEWCYRNDDKRLIPMRACICGIAYAPDCPVDEHRRRNELEDDEILEIAGHKMSRREKWQLKNECRHQAAKAVIDNAVKAAQDICSRICKGS